MDICETAARLNLEMVPCEESDQDWGWPVLRLDDDAVAMIARMEPDPEVVELEGEDVLGTYTPMSSPGVITLYWKRIGSFFWHTLVAVQRSGVPIEKRDLRRLALLTVNKTYHHERFHFFCDVARQLMGSQFERLREEALAVAWSHHVIETRRPQWNSATGLLGEGPYRAFMQRIFRHTAPGYRDWVHFQSRHADDGRTPRHRDRYR